MGSNGLASGIDGAESEQKIFDGADVELKLALI